MNKAELSLLAVWQGLCSLQLLPIGAEGILWKRCDVGLSSDSIIVADKHRKIKIYTDALGVTDNLG
ncbi:hypothetical protein [Bacillus ndiopicus]|uniref:hypothetical protein n=1 Tax=Bacillus ndiopicus TaxID=1347368 RepID=UPI0005A88B80|nr:hypothetical protein [Bacillus ndiopicus]